MINTTLFSLNSACQMKGNIIRSVLKNMEKFNIRVKNTLVSALKEIY